MNQSGGGRVIGGAALVLVFTAGCAAQAWQRPGASETLTRSDLQACHNQAVVRSFNDPATYTIAGGDPFYRNWGFPSSERELAINNYASQCMRSLGYELGPRQR